MSTMERVVEHAIVSRGDPAFTHKMFKSALCDDNGDE